MNVPTMSKQERIDETVANLERHLRDLADVSVSYSEDTKPMLIQVVNINGREYAHAISVPDGYFESSMYGALNPERAMRGWLVELFAELDAGKAA